MKNASYILWILLGLSIVAVGATRSDLGGTWVLDHGNTAVNGAPIVGQRSNLHPTISITYDENRLAIKSSFSPIQREYVVDGTERVSDIIGSIYTAKWDGPSIVIDEKINANTPFGAASMTSHEVWSLSEDGTSVTRSLSSRTSQGNSITTEVYNRTDARSH
jgi:hypothetical protein